jgi:hypothetical protein
LAFRAYYILLICAITSTMSDGSTHLSLSSHILQNWERIGQVELRQHLVGEMAPVAHCRRKSFY